MDDLTTVLMVVQLMVSGMAIGLAIAHLVRWRDTGSTEALWFGLWSLVLAVGVGTNAGVLQVSGPALEVLMTVRTVALMGAILAAVPAVGIAAGIDPPRWFVWALVALVVVRLVLWMTTDLVYAHRVGPTGLPEYGPALVPLTLTLVVLWSGYLWYAAMHWRSSEERSLVVTGVAVTMLLVLLSLFVPDAAAAELLTGTGALPVLVAVLLTEGRRQRAAERARRRLEHDRARIARDVRHANEQLREAMRIREDILAATTHELRTPLTPMLGMLELVRRRLEVLDPDSIRDHLAVVERNAERLFHLVDELLNASRLQAGHVIGEATAVAVRPVFDDVTHLWSDLSDAMTVDCADDVVAWVDAGHLAQILTNLISNAAKYGAPPYRLAASSDGRTTRISVEDHGPGVPEAFLQALFEPFAQASVGDARTSSGVGLGLSIARALAAASDGELRHERVDPHGARFVLDLPATPPHAVIDITEAGRRVRVANVPPGRRHRH